MWLWLSALAFGGIWGVLHREMKKSGGGGGRGGGEGVGGKIKRWINFSLFILWTMSLLLAPQGEWGNFAAIIARAFRAVLGWICRMWLPGIAVSDIAFVMALILIVAIGIDLWGRKPDKVARFGLIALVPLCLLAGGGLGGAVIELTTSLTGTGADVLQNLATS